MKLISTGNNTLRLRAKRKQPRNDDTEEEADDKEDPSKIAIGSDDYKEDRDYDIRMGCSCLVPCLIRSYIRQSSMCWFWLLCCLPFFFFFLVKYKKLLRYKFLFSFNYVLAVIKIPAYAAISF